MSASIVVNARCGRLRGSIEDSFEGYKYCSFKGIPYAEPPVGQLRFKDPVPLEPWTGEKNATSFGPMCAQTDAITQVSQGDDDCLYLNVYTKSIASTKRRPVMVWIHGGAFMFGSGDDMLYGPDYLLRKDIVLVTINYRLGVLGFLNFNDPVAPGNQGLKDQIMALKWVQQNIASFSGDPKNVTIFGESAGGASVHYLALSPLAKGLFHKAILQSGVACNTWACSSTVEHAYKICEILGNKSKDPAVLVEFLRTIDCKTLIEAQRHAKFPLDKIQSVFSFGPCVDVKSKDPVVPMHPREAVKKGLHVPCIIGCNTREGILFLDGMGGDDFEKFDKNFEEHLNPVTRKMIERNKITPNEFRAIYFKSDSITEQDSEEYVDFSSDVHFIEGIHRTVKYQVKHNSAPTYFYRFSYDKGFSLTKASVSSTLHGSSHFDEVQHLFSMRVLDILGIEKPQKGTVQYKIVQQMTEMWANFAKYGRPTPVTNDLITTHWLPVTDERIFRTLDIGPELRMTQILNFEENLSCGKNIRHKL
ncbi:hypothetical protein QAD02_023331 [Eretmocerus hayati]|uniref:Uncharacterized protein n=1 Tax=Eretmocerus hayati TaxID=131215 RepID=A0ACC2PYW1_9HYME|nr:hypothetical protein QAD02_023331 [Eretmocerus hayati]